MEKLTPVYCAERLEAVEKKIEEYNSKHGARMEELELRDTLSGSETKELALRKSNRAKLEKKEEKWNKRLDEARMQQPGIFY